MAFTRFYTILGHISSLVKSQRFRTDDKVTVAKSMSLPDNGVNTTTIQYPLNKPL